MATKVRSMIIGTTVALVAAYGLFSYTRTKLDTSGDKWVVMTVTRKPTRHTVRVIIQHYINGAERDTTSSAEPLWTEGTWARPGETVRLTADPSNDDPTVITCQLSDGTRTKIDVGTPDCDVSLTA